MTSSTARTSHGNASYERVTKSTPCGRGATRDDDRPGGKARSRDQVVPQPADEAPGLGVAVVVQADDDHSRVAAARVDVGRALAVRDRLHLPVGRGRVDEAANRGAHRRASGPRPGARCRRGSGSARRRPAPGDRAGARSPARTPTGRGSTRSSPASPRASSPPRPQGTRTARPSASTSHGRPVTAAAKPCHHPRRAASGRALRRGRRARRGARAAGSATPASETSGTRSPPIPSERTNGTGTKRSAPSPIATARPENATARPAVAIVRTTASSARATLRALDAVAVHDQERVVDRQAEPDQHDEVRHVRRHRHHVGECVDGRERSGDRARGEEERDQDGGREAEERDQDGERDRQRDQLGPPEVGGDDRVEIVLQRRSARDEGLRRSPGARSARRTSSVWDFASWSGSVVVIWP